MKEKSFIFNLLSVKSSDLAVHDFLKKTWKYAGAEQMEKYPGKMSGFSTSERAFTSPAIWQVEHYKLIIFLDFYPYGVDNCFF